MPRNRDDVARVAAQVIADEGLDGASMREIASRMGVTIGTLTHHFRNREDLLLATFEGAVAAGRGRAEHAARGLTGTARLTALLSEALPTSETRRTEAAVWLAFSMSAITNKDHARLATRLYEEWEDALAVVLVDLGTRNTDPGAAARQLIAVTDGIALRAMATPAMPASEQERLLAAAIAGILGTP
jgi:AcrR family transcriptional regulator